jgi:hypothetical protein
MSWRVFEILDWWGLAFFSPAEHCITLITIRGHPYRTSAPKGGGGVSQKRTRADVGGRGGQRQNADVRKIENYLKFLDFSLPQMEILTTDNLRKLR